MRSLSCAQIAAEIEQNLDFLPTTMRNAPARHRSVRALFEQSWQRLKAAEQEVLRQLAIFRGGCLRPAAAAVAHATLPQLTTLVDHSLLRRDDDGRYQMHELIRQFALVQLEADPDLHDAVCRRHSTYYLDFLAERTEAIKSDRQTAVVAEIAAEIDNVRARRLAPRRGPQRPGRAGARRHHLLAL